MGGGGGSSLQGLDCLGTEMTVTWVMYRSKRAFDQEVYCSLHFVMTLDLCVVKFFMVAIVVTNNVVLFNRIICCDLIFVVVVPIRELFLNYSFNGEQGQEWVAYCVPSAGTEASFSGCWFHCFHPLNRWRGAFSSDYPLNCWSDMLTGHAVGISMDCCGILEDPVWDTGGQDCAQLSGGLVVASMSHGQFFIKPT